MKKSVVALLVLIAVLLAFSKINTLTGFQILDLPAPPSPPGMAAEQAAPTLTPAPIVVPVPTPLVPAPTPPVVEVPRVSSELEGRVGILEQRLNSLQSQVEAMDVNLQNIRVATGRPYVEEPTFLSSLSNLRGSISRNTVLSVSLSVFILLIVISIIISGIVQRKNTNEENKRLIRQYLMNYQKAGYRLETLRMHLRACGWRDQLIDEAIKGLPR